MSTELSSPVRAARRQSRSARPSIGSFIVGIALLQALWVATVPPFRASDEFDHAYRANAVAHGQWLAREEAAAGRGGLVRVTPDLVRAAHRQCADLSYTGPDNCAPAGGAGDGLVYVASGAASYHPAYYWVIGTAARWLEGTSALYVMRLSSALLCLLFLSLALWSTTRRRRSRWTLVASSLALSPVLLFSTAMAAPNGLEMAAAFALWSALLSLDLRCDPSTRLRLMGIATLSAVVLASLRTLGPLFVLLVVGVLLIVRGGDLVRATLLHRRHLVAGCATTGGVAGLAALWSMTSGLAGGGAEPQGATEWQPGTLLLWPLQSIAAFPFRDLPGPIAVYPIFVAAVAGIVVAAWRVGQAREKAGLLVALVVALGLPVLITAATRDDVGVMWQGRYGLPVSVGFVLVAGWVLDDAVTRGRLGRPRFGLVGPGALVLAAVTTACFVKIVTDERLRRVSVEDAAWLQPSAWLLGSVTVLAWAALSVAVCGPRPVLLEGSAP